jgi:hypothetical protein
VDQCAWKEDCFAVVDCDIASGILSVLFYCVLVVIIRQQSVLSGWDAGLHHHHHVTMHGWQ